jgi:LmbE family N-acetylglucosaminyl deacetylase
MSKEFKSYRLLVVAHPDDETLFFSAALLQQTTLPWIVVCVTKQNADGTSAARAAQFKKACQKLKVAKSIHWNFLDAYEKRLDLASLEQHLKKLPRPKEVYTHGVVGEYGHPHHQDISYAVHKFFAGLVKVWSPAYNTFAEKKMALTQEQYQVKSDIYNKIYKGETLRFSQYLPNRTVDEFTQLNWSEVKEIYFSICEKRVPQKSKLKKYKWFYEFLAKDNIAEKKRPF